MCEPKNLGIRWHLTSPYAFPSHSHIDQHVDPQIYLVMHLRFYIFDVQEHRAPGRRTRAAAVHATPSRPHLVYAHSKDAIKSYFSFLKINKSFVMLLTKIK